MTFIFINCPLVGLNPLIQQVRHFEISDSVTQHIYYVSTVCHPQVSSQSHPYLVCACISLDRPQLCVGLWLSAVDTDISLENIQCSLVEDVKTGICSTVCLFCGNQVGVGNASRGDMEQVLSRSPIGRKGILGRKHGKYKGKETGQFVSCSENFSWCGMSVHVAEYMEALSAWKSG